ncbi:MAG: isoaspartyl peptidase/L-asparaginase family protein [Deltaproteobacteria bacterium]
MKRTLLFVALALVFVDLSPNAGISAENVAVPGVVLGIHGGTGVAKKEMTPQLEKDLRAGLERALKAGYAVLKKPGGTSLDAVEAAIRVLEDDEWFNAGKGAVFTHDGRNELDASIMEGRSKKAGAVAGVTTVKNPISAARAVKEKTKHVMLIGRGAELFAEEAGLEIVDPKYFRTQHRWDQLQKELAEDRKESERRKGENQPGGKTGKPGAALRPVRAHEWSTVGAVALDSAGNLAAGTSTGGMSNKRYGRVGDSPIIGAGTYADNRTCAVSCTGHGEFFIRYAVSHDISALVEYKGLEIQKAADQVIRGKLKAVEGEGAAIVLDPQGNFAMSYNSEGLYRGYVTSEGKITVLLYEK